MTLAGLPYAGEKSKPHDYKQKDKNEGPSEIMGFNGKTVWRLQKKKRLKTKLSTFQKTQWNRRPLNTLIEYGPYNQEEQNRTKLKKKTFRLNLLELCKTRTKSSPDKFNFYVDLIGHDMVSDAGRATKCSSKFKAPSIQTKSTKNAGPFEGDFHGKTVWRIQTK